MPLLKLEDDCLVLPGHDAVHVLNRRGAFDLRGSDLHRLHERLHPFLRGDYGEDQLLAAVPAAQVEGVRAYLARLRQVGALRDAGAEGTAAPEGPDPQGTPDPGAAAWGPALPATSFRSGGATVHLSLLGFPEADAAGGPETVRLGFTSPRQAGRLLLHPRLLGGRSTVVVVDPPEEAVLTADELARRAGYARWLLRNELDLAPAGPRARVFRLRPDGTLERVAMLEPGARPVVEQLALVRFAEVEQVPLAVVHAAHPFFTTKMAAVGVTHRSAHQHLLRHWLARERLGDAPGRGRFRAGPLDGSPRGCPVDEAFAPDRLPRMVVGGTLLELRVRAAEDAAERRAGEEVHPSAWEAVDLLREAATNPVTAYLANSLGERRAALAAQLRRTGDGLWLCQAGPHRGRSFFRAKAVAEVLLAAVRDAFHSAPVAPEHGEPVPALDFADFASRVELRHAVRGFAEALRREGKAPRLRVVHLTGPGVSTWVGDVVGANGVGSRHGGVVDAAHAGEAVRLPRPSPPAEGEPPEGAGGALKPPREITFSEVLNGPGNDVLRAQVRTLASSWGGAALHVDTVLGAGRRDNLARADAAAPPASYLLFDLHRLVVYDEPRDGAEPRVGSVLRFVLDDYPVAPVSLLLERVAEQPYHFFYSHRTLDVFPLLAAARRPGTVVACDLVTGEILAAAALPHPESYAVTRLPAGRAEDAGRGPHRAAPPWRDRWTDASLRAGALPAVDDLLSPLVGIARERHDSVDHASLPFATTRVGMGGGQHSEFCHGKALRPAEARLVGMCEAAERFQTAFLGPDESLVFGSLAQLRDHALDPRALFFPESQPTDPGLHRWSEDEAMYWTRADAAGGDRSLLVPAQEVWFNTRRLLGERYFVRATTSGCATGGSPAEATLFALFEAVERDAFLTAWYLRRTLRRIDPASVALASFQLLRRRWEFAYPGYALHFFDATSDTGIPTVWAIAVRVRGNGPKTFHAAASRLSVGRACFTALKDLTGFIPRFSSAQRDRAARLLDDPAAIRGPEEHMALYALDDTFPRLAFLGFDDAPRISAAEAGGHPAVPASTRYNLREVLESLVSHLAGAGVSVLVKDVTHPTLAARGLHCVRVLAPGLYPLWFGPTAHRFAVTERLRRLAREHAGARHGGVEEYNLGTHPLA